MLKSPHAAKQFRWHPNFLFEALDEPPLADSNTLCDPTNRQFRFGGREQVQRESHRVVALRRAEHTGRELILQQIETLCRGTSGAEAFAELDCRRAPERFQVNMTVCQ